jgi:uncharacterized protein (UPF0333 family)
LFSSFFEFSWLIFLILLCLTILVSFPAIISVSETQTRGGAVVAVIAIAPVHGAVSEEWRKGLL